MFGEVGSLASAILPPKSGGRIILGALTHVAGPAEAFSREAAMLPSVFLSSTRWDSVHI